MARGQGDTQSSLTFCSFGSESFHIIYEINLKTEINKRNPNVAAGCARAAATHTGRRGQEGARGRSGGSRTPGVQAHHGAGGPQGWADPPAGWGSR